MQDLLKEKETFDIKDDPEWPQVWDLHGPVNENLDAKICSCIFYSKISFTFLYIHKQAEFEGNPFVGYSGNCTGGDPWRSPKGWKLISKGEM